MSFINFFRAGIRFNSGAKNLQLAALKEEFKLERK
jgi:hypothetical protein